MKLSAKAKIVAGSTLALAMIVQANICVLGLCVEAAPVAVEEQAPSCHSAGAEHQSNEKQDEHSCASCCDSQIFATELKVELATQLQILDWQRILPVLAANARPQAILTFLDLPPPPAANPLYLQNRVLLN